MLPPALRSGRIKFQLLSQALENANIVRANCTQKYMIIGHLATQGAIVLSK